MEWLTLAADGEVGTRPLGVTAAGGPLGVLRPGPGAEPVVFADRCPHRLVPLSAATPIDGRLQCAYHGWGVDAPGARVALPPRVRDVQLQIAAADLPPADPDDLFTNEDPALARAWHPVALIDERPDS